ncbi:MAG: tetratricopeptide repeat protein [Myxococcota bacterium]
MKSTAAALLVTGLLGLGCAGMLPGAERATLPPTDGPAELDFLVGQELEMDGRVEEARAAYERALRKDPHAVFLLKRLAELSARSDRLTDALVYAERAFELDPDDEGLRLFLGSLYRLRRDPESAARVLRDDAGAPVSTDASVLLFGILLEGERHVEAKQAAEWLIAHEPESVRGYIALAEVTERMGDAPGSEAVLRDGLAEHPGDLALFAALARSRRERGDRVGEIGVYREVLSIHEDHHATLLAMAEAQIALGQEAEANVTLERIEAAHPGDLRTLLQLGFRGFEAGEYEAAEHRFQRALSQQPEQHEVAYFLGVVQRRMGKEAEAIATLDRIPTDHERYADGRVQVAGIYEKDGDFAGAQLEVEKAREVEPSRPLDLYAASLRAKGGDVAGAIAFLDDMLDESPEDAEVLYNIGVIHGEAKNVEEAIRYMRIVLGLNPDHASALNYVGYTFAERGENLEEAEAMIERALELRPEDGYITDSLGWVYYMRARPLLAEGNLREAHLWLDRAVDELERAAALTGGDPVISEHLGDAHLALGDKQRALEYYEEAAGLDPRPEEQPELHEKLGRLREELGRR